LGTGHSRRHTTYPFPSPGGTRCSPALAILWSWPWTSSTLCLDSGAEEMSAALTPRQIFSPHRGIFSSRHQSSCSWTGKTSSSKCTRSSLASTRGLCWRQAATARVDLWTAAREQGLGWMEWARSISIAANVGNGKPTGGAATARWISIGS
jgi:hypothetical protein